VKAILEDIKKHQLSYLLNQPLVHVNANAKYKNIYKTLSMTCMLFEFGEFIDSNEIKEELMTQIGLRLEMADKSSVDHSNARKL
jgi:hypothetical protein